MTSPEFCRKCGAGFPPRSGEGRCVEWELCRATQTIAAPDAAPGMPEEPQAIKELLKKSVV